MSKKEILRKIFLNMKPIFGFLFIYLFIYFFKKKERDGLMQRMSRGRDQWQLNAHRLDCFNHVNHVSTRSNGQESLRSRTRSSTHVDIEKGFLEKVIFWKTRVSLENIRDCQRRNLEKLEFLFSPCVKKKGKHIFSDVQKIKKWKWKMMTEKKFRKKLGDVRKWYFVWKKEIFVRKGKIENGQRTKKTKPKGEEQLKGVSQRDEKREWKKRLKRNTKILQKKGAIRFVKTKKKCQARKRVKMRRVDRESEHQEGTYTRRRNMKRVKIRRKENEKQKVENEEDHKRKEIWTGRFFCW